MSTAFVILMDAVQIDHNGAHSMHCTSAEDQLHGFWERIPEEHAATARSLETALTRHAPPSDPRYEYEQAMCMWCCHCDFISAIKIHLRKE